MILFNELRIYIILFFFNLTVVSVAQEHKCGTTIDDKTLAFISQNFDENVFDLRSRTNQSVERLAISAHIIRRSDGSAGLTENQLISAIETVNSFYSNANLEFFLFGDIDYIDNDEYSDYNTDLEDAIANTRDIPNTINIYFANSVRSGSDPLCGYAYFPGNPDRIFMDNGCTMNGTTLSHEIGHYLTLYHTHGKTNNGTTDELVDGSNCETAGDDVCDTLADPNLTGRVNSNCQYTSSIRDANGDLYQPNAENIMSYAPQNCRRIFSNGQYDRAYLGFINFRNYITQKGYIADFKAEKTIVCVGEEILFSDFSYGNYEALQWEFIGASQENSTDTNPVIIYNAPGTYDVKLTVIGNDGGTDFKVIERAIKVIDHSDITSNSADLDFENSQIIDFDLLSQEDDFTFSIENVGKASDKSLSMQFYNYDEKLKKDLIVLDPLANPGNKDYIVSFDYAFTYYTNESSEAIDQIKLLYKSCDQEGEIWSVNGKDDATAEPKSIAFVPADGDWVHIEKYVPISSNAEFVQLALETINGNGNNFYIDNISVKFSESIVIRNLEIADEPCAGDENGSLIVEASYNGNVVEYSLDDSNYSTNGSFLNLKAGDYKLFIRSEGDKITKDIKIRSIRQRPAKPVILFSNNELRLLASSSVIEWYYNDQLVDDTGTTAIEFMGAGNYYVIVRNESGCESISDIFTVLGNQEGKIQLTIFPNPTTGESRIEGINIQGIENIKLLDPLGKEIFFSENLETPIIDLSKVPIGVYFLLIDGEEGFFFAKIMKQE